MLQISPSMVDNFLQIAIERIRRAYTIMRHRVCYSTKSDNVQRAKVPEGQFGQMLPQRSPWIVPSLISSIPLFPFLGLFLYAAITSCSTDPSFLYSFVNLSGNSHRSRRYFNSVLFIHCKDFFWLFSSLERGSLSVKSFIKHSMTHRYAFSLSLVCSKISRFCFINFRKGTPCHQNVFGWQNSFFLKVLCSRIFYYVLVWLWNLIHHSFFQYFYTFDSPRA